MKAIYIILCMLCLLFFASCEKEEAIIPRSSELPSRFEFPEGDEGWDHELMEIYKKYTTMLIYKNLDSADFTRSWVAGGGTGAAGRIGKPLDDELAEFYTDFVKNQVFAFLQPELVAGVLPNYIYLIQDFRLKMTFGGDMSLANYWDGMDFWGFCLKMDQKGLSPYTKYFDLPKTPWEYKLRRGVILQNIISKIVQKGKIAVPAEFEEEFDYKTQIKYNSVDIDDPNYYVTRGFPGKFTETSYLNFLNYMMISDITPEKNFISYMHLGMRYSRDSVLIKYPQEKFPKIIQYYDFTMKYVKDNYGWDLTEMEKWPVVENKN